MALCTPPMLCQPRGFTLHAGPAPPDSLTILDIFPQASPLCGPRECSSCGRDPARVDAPTPQQPRPDPAAQGPLLSPGDPDGGKGMPVSPTHRGAVARLHPPLPLSPSSHRLRAVDATVCLVGYQEEVRKKGINGPRGQSPAREEPGTGKYVGIDL